MRYGGGCRKPGTCTGSDCVETPLLDPSDNSIGLGYSSYFALDITDQNNPTLLWEFSNDQLGFSTSGPAIVRESVLVGGVTHTERNGKWFVVLGSGPTGPIDPVTNQFLGHSDQNLRLFVLDLKSGSLLSTIDTGVHLAFAGSLMNATVDADLDYQDELVYVPYVKDSGDGTWTNGGVLRLSTHKDTDPGNWSTSYLIDNIGPVTTAVAKLVNNTVRGPLNAATNNIWAYVGTGRYFFKLTETLDDATAQRQIIGLKDPCVISSSFDPTCHDSRTLSQLTNVTNIANAPTGDATNGWYINLDANGVPDASAHAERCITDPLSTTGGIVFFTTFKPYSDSCAMGGKSFIWAAKYNSGGDASALLKGQALIQVSTGSIEQLKLSEAFRDSVTGQSTGNRKSAGMEGVPPTAQGLSVITSPSAAKKALHVKER
jgi:type IV pilus assembly protein PilY1